MTLDPRHSKQTPTNGGIHVIHAFEYADAAAREAATGFAAADVGKAALQLDTKAFWILTDESPITWAPLSLPTEVFTSLIVRNETGASLVRGKAVAITGWSIAQDLPLVSLADKDIGSLRPSIGIVENTIPHLSNGTIISLGFLYNINTSGFALTDLLILGDDGYLIRPPPDTDPFTGEVQYLASVAKLGTTDGALFVNISQGLDRPPPPRTITVGQTAADFNSIKAAVAYAVSKGASSSAWWDVIVYPGTYLEDPITVPVGVYIQATAKNTVSVIANNPIVDLLTITGGWLSGLKLSGVNDEDAEAALVHISGTNTTSTLTNIGLTDCFNGIVVDGYANVSILDSSATVDAASSAILNACVLIDGYGTNCNINGFDINVPFSILPSYSINPIQYGILVQQDSVLVASNLRIDMATKNSTAAGILVENDATATIFSSNIKNITGSALRVGATSGAIHIQSSVLINNTINFDIQSAEGEIFAICHVDDEKTSAVDDSNFTGIIQNHTLNQTLLTNQIIYEYPTGTTVPLSNVIHDLFSSGLTDGGEVVEGTGLHAIVSPGVGWVSRGVDEADEDVARVSWDGYTFTLFPNATNFICFNGNTQSLQLSVSAQGAESITLATIITNATNIKYLHRTVFPIEGFLKDFNNYLLTTRKVIIRSGLAVSAGTTPRKLNVSDGSWYISLSLQEYDGYDGYDTSFSTYYGSGVLQASSIQSIDITNYDNAGTLSTMTDGYYRTDTLFLTSDGRSTIVYGKNQYATVQSAESAAAAIPYTFLEYTAIGLAKLVVLKNYGISSIVDIRPTGSGGSSSSSGGGTSNHSLLSNLGVDDHTQYLRTDGGRTMTGNLNLGANNITNVNLVDGVDVPSHASRHNPGGVDAIATATPLTISTANAEGVAPSVARSDHVHAHGNLIGGSTHALAVANTSAGFISASDQAKLNTVSANSAALTASAPANVSKSAAVVGTDGYAAHSDHKHDIDTAASSIGIGAGSLEGSATTLSRSDHNHAIRETGGPTDLTMGIVLDGYALARSGTNIIGGQLIALTNLAPANITKATAAVGVGLTAARSDHKHDISTAAPAIGIGSGNSEGSAITLARSDHNHTIRESSGPTDLTMSSVSDGYALTRSGTNIIGGQLIALTNSAPANITKATAAVGVSLTAARSDHKHDITTAAPSIGIGASNTEGVATSLARSDHNHTIRESGGPTDMAMGIVLDGYALTRSGTNIIGGQLITLSNSAPANITKATASVGVGLTAARTDHKHDISTAAPSIGIGSGNTEGVATTLARSDHNHTIRESSGPTDLTISSVADGYALTRSGTSIIGGQLITLTNLSPANITKATAAVGVGLTAARRDHKHDVDTAAPSIGIGSGNTEGVATTLTRSDHNHAIRETGGPTDLTMGAVSDGYALTRSGTSIAGGLLIALTNSAPTTSTKSTSLVGTAITAARADHKHDITTAAPSIGIGSGNSEGSAVSLARSDHNHTIRESSGPTDLTLGSIPDGYYLSRSGSTIVGAAGTSIFDQRDEIIFDHFISSAATSLSFGNYNWKRSNTGAGNDLLLTAEAGHPGIANIVGGTGANGRSAISVADGFENIAIGGNGTFEFEALISPRTTVASASLVQLLMGLGNGWNTAGSNPLTDGIYWRFTAGSDTNFVGACRASSTETTRASSTVPTVGNWYRVGFIWTPGGTPSVQFKLNGANVGAVVTTNIPTAIMSAGFRISVNSSGSSPNMFVDYVLVKQVSNKET